MGTQRSLKAKASVKAFLMKTLARTYSFRKITGVGYFGLNKIDRKLEKYLNYNNGYFVELGANDGVAQSNTLVFEKFRNFNGLLIEPYGPNFQMCKNNRSLAHDYFMGACVSFEYESDQMELAYSNLMTTPLEGDSQLSDPGAHAENGRKFLSGEEVFRFRAKASTLTDILNSAQAPSQIDLLSLDVEGGELEVLKGIDHKKYRFSVICVEARNFEIIRNYLESVGYRYKEQLSNHDYVFLNHPES